MTYKLTCGNCNWFRKENPEPVDYYGVPQKPIYNGRCLCYGYYIRSHEEICTDFERGG